MEDAALQTCKAVQPDLANLGRPTVLMLAGRDNCLPPSQAISVGQCRPAYVVPAKSEDKKLMGALALMQLSKAQTQEKESRESGNSMPKSVPMHYLQL